ncbi:oxetanocin A resistance protein [Cytobacillus firmus]|uniref:Oxetanocin A resistance protein n=1 Tax=Cytobacillus firmus TaxID=1399 RepID=A0A800N9J9_CYTFI|nr:oxetanocin A resistance protein [Cytobacillus firmus]
MQNLQTLLSIKKQASHVQILRLIIAVKFMLTSGEKASEDVPHLSALVQARKFNSAKGDMYTKLPKGLQRPQYWVN